MSKIERELLLAMSRFLLHAWSHFDEAGWRLRSELANAITGVENDV
jgi:hypothetical protein